MIVSKCDNCRKEYSEGECPDWVQITGERGILIIGANKSVTKYGVLDFCCPDCAKEFIESVIVAMNSVESPTV